MISTVSSDRQAVANSVLGRCSFPARVAECQKWQHSDVPLAEVIVFSSIGRPSLQLPAPMEGTGPQRLQNVQP